MGLTEADREMLRAATQRAKERAARHGASCGVMVFSEGGVMSVEMKPGLWRRRDGTAMTIRLNDGSRWVSADGYHYWDDGRFIQGQEHKLDVIEFLGEIPEPQPEPQPQPDAAEELAALKDDRDRWQARARQAEGRVQTLTQDLAAITANRDAVFRRIHETENDRDKWRRRVAELERQVNDLQAQLATARQQLQDRDAADQVPGNEQLRQQITQLIAEREGLSQQLRQYEQQNVEMTKDLEGLRFMMRHAEQQRSILLETSQDQLGQIRMAERVIGIMCDRIAQLAIEGA